MNEHSSAPARGQNSSRGIVAETLRQTARTLGAFVGASLLTIATVAALGLTHSLDLGPGGTAEPLAAGLSGATAKAQRLAAVHDCWHGTPPADMRGRLPGHVVVTVAKAGSTRTVYSATQVSAALDHVFATPHAGLTVHAFCR